METSFSITLTAIAIACGLAATPALAQTSGGTTTTTTASVTTTTTTTTVPATTTSTTSSTTSAGTKLSASYANWAGSPENSAALVNGLRTGQPITLTSAPTAAPGGIATTTTFTPPTKPMGYGNVRIALALAQQQLASQGISQPTPQQMQTALMGGSLTTTGPTGVQTTDVQGVLQMRASGMGWGKIANTMGYKLGAVMSGKAAATTATSTSEGSNIATADGSTSARSTKSQYGKAGSGITTASGSTSGTGSAGGQHGKSGIVTAAGGAGSGITTGMGSTHAHGGSGVVTANGSGAGGQTHGGGQGKGGK